jgi:hypothetical protein
MRSGQQPLISYDVKPSPRVSGEIDVKSYIETLQEALRSAKMDLMQYKKLIETYRSEIASM